MLLRTRIILGVSVAMLVLAVSIWFANRYIESIYQSRVTSERTLAKTKLVEHILTSHREMMRSQMKSITRDAKSLSAIANRDLIKVKEEVEPTFNRLSTTGIIDDVIVVNAANQVLFHAPINHDHLSESDQLQASVLHRKVFFGKVRHKSEIALTLTFPIYQEGKLIGAAAFTKDFGSIIDKIKVSDSADVLILDKDRKPLLNTNKTLYAPDQFNKFLATVKKGKVWQSEDQYFELTTVPVSDFRNKPVAHLVIANNITSAHMKELRLSLVTHTALATSVILFLVLLGIWLHNQFSPLTHVVGLLEKLTEGDYDSTPALNPGKNDEIGSLINSMEVFRESLKWKAREQRIERVRSKILQEALSRQEEMQYMQRQFVSMASHEFRTPLAIIDTVIHRMNRRFKKGDLPAEDGIEQVIKIRTAIERLSGLMERTLTAARMEQGKIEIKHSPCNIRKIIVDTCIRQQEISPTHTINYTIEDLPDAIWADGGALEQVLTNLLSNAVKYSPDNPKVQVSAHSSPENVFISVRDHGVGVDEEDLMRLGERFFRAKTSAGIVGTGIGLHLIRWLILEHDGILDIDSEKGKGSTFKIRLPIKAKELDEYSSSQTKEASPPKSSVA